jgi:hypothetical protein
MKNLSLLAARCQTGVDKDGNPTYIETTFDWGCQSEETAIMDTIVTIFNWFSVGVATIVVVFIVVGAIQYMTATGNQDKTKKGIETIRNAIIALVLYLIMWVLLNYLVPGGVFS